MHTGLLRHRDIVAGVIALALSFTLSACGTRTASSGERSALDRIKKAGKITIAMDASYEPNEFEFHGRIIGFDVDLGTEIARNLGVPAHFQNVKFDKILPAVESKKYDLGMSSLTDNEQREQSLDFVTYFSAGTGLMVKAGNPLKLSPVGLSLCGRRIAVQEGTTQEDELVPKSSAKPEDGARVSKCKQAGKRAPVKVSLPDQDAANRALARGHADAVLADSPVASYAAKESGGKLATTGKAYDTAPYGIAIPKDESELRDAIQKIVKNLIGNGIYKVLTDKWGVSDGGITDPKINGAAG
ncbi:ABC transporter substrate-binding protein [Actinoallomurus bryophytorum]|uniref:Amino acid ABC transporter substrate-binding protein (PAAT family) n=1 Tax=Actinoallomurus bryophytorum TaxID=1490222 RepID=A0A543CEU4_9ACTN|nr:ABC transporter substrate-binding protein [Actinoallomurus bryophytorum]TQL95520.1 amino acid ABC transporter substrate-binding protein (PAAT family) [Actinoallomurus bryophytorum]